MNVADKEWRVEHITGDLPRNDAVVDAVPFVYGVPIVAGAASRVWNRSLPLVFASANHILPTIVLEDLLRTRIIAIPSSSGDATMWVALQVNIALWA